MGFGGSVTPGELVAPSVWHPTALLKSAPFHFFPAIFGPKKMGGIAFSKTRTLPNESGELGSWDNNAVR